MHCMHVCTVYVFPCVLCAYIKVCATHICGMNMHVYVLICYVESGMCDVYMHVCVVYICCVHKYVL